MREVQEDSEWAAACSVSTWTDGMLVRGVGEGFCVLARAACFLVLGEFLGLGSDAEDLASTGVLCLAIDNYQEHSHERKANHAKYSKQTNYWMFPSGPGIGPQQPTCSKAE